jgi:hypothetical protein
MKILTIGEITRCDYCVSARFFKGEVQKFVVLENVTIKNLNMTENDTVAKISLMPDGLLLNIQIFKHLNMPSKFSTSNICQSRVTHRPQRIAI